MLLLINTKVPPALTFSSWVFLPYLLLFGLFSYSYSYMGWKFPTVPASVKCFMSMFSFCLFLFSLLMGYIVICFLKILSPYDFPSFILGIEKVVIFICSFLTSASLVFNFDSYSLDFEDELKEDSYWFRWVKPLFLLVNRPTVLSIPRKPSVLIAIEALALPGLPLKVVLPLAYYFFLDSLSLSSKSEVRSELSLSLPFYFFIDWIWTHWWW